MKSEVARIREEIDLEIRSMQMMNLPSAVASHRSINARYRNLGIRQGDLAKLIGEEAANNYVYDAYVRVVG